jgi:hypothetical protein
MIVLLATLLGIDLWMIAVALLALVWHERRVKRTPNVFGCKLRVVAGVASGLKAKFPRRKNYARWVHDVLVVRSGPGLLRYNLLPVMGVASPAHGSNPTEVKGLGEKPQLLTFQLDDGAVVEMAVPETASARLMNPVFGERPAAAAP